MLEEMIKYYDEKSWEEYYNQIINLFVRIEEVLKLRKSLFEKAGDKFVGELIQESKIWEEVLFGGLREDGSFPENALARFYREILGFGLSEEDTKKVTSRLKEGLSLDVASSDIKVRREETEFISLLGKIRKDIQLLSPQVGKSLPDINKVEITKSTDAVEKVRELLKSAKKLLPLYNPLSFFVLSIQSTPRFYLEKQYEKLFEEETKRILGKYGVRISNLIFPDLPHPGERERRSIVGLDRISPGWLIRNIVLNCYKLFQIQGLRKFFAVDDEFNKYLQHYSETIKGSIALEYFEEVLNRLGWASEKDFLGLKVEEPFKVSKYDSAKIEGGDIKLYYETVGYTEFIAFIAPLTFFGFAYIEPKSEKEFGYQVILGWERG
ncbi:hypothetical protein [Pyrococcus kukulkanii]|uniref:Uncharacterized protein n=1 Tax=Pyrococcus kukulkanii TaxID=1609559 RepID=A0A127B9W0_9EURY|nr:hypothetical protein [Pyrococcus kukulkanii]AMM53456.1 hypothetical protein TQ32_02335 [Pyrococcus kukulkanii]